MQWKPNTTVAAVIEKDNRFLLVEEEIDGKLVFNQPAGHLEKTLPFYTDILGCTVGPFEKGRWQDIDFWGNELTLKDFLRYFFSL